SHPAPGCASWRRVKKAIRFRLTTETSGCPVALMQIPLEQVQERVLGRNFFDDQIDNPRTLFPSRPTSPYRRPVPIWLRTRSLAARTPTAIGPEPGNGFSSRAPCPPPRH